MVSKLTMAKHAVELGHLKDILADLGYDSRVLEPSEGVPIPLLIMALPLDQKGNERYLNFLFVPVEDEELQSLEMLQLHTVIPCQLEESQRVDTQRLVSTLNSKIGLGCIGLDNEDNVYYRYVYPKAKYELFDDSLVSETVSLFIYMLERFSDLLTSVAMGQQDLDTALSLVPTI
jgi:hypothetical protein